MASLDAHTLVHTHTVSSSVTPDAQTLTFRTAIMIALLGALRWRQETNAFASVTGADRDSVGGALWSN